ncbi:class I SAM-dependent methyltransferase [Halalkalibacterium halodurans]|uniref:BH2058 protein n=1 Tax=Halalkalibacterium halodurans (strain ATCC BAA-125 / DSM 18197 / FERM 7344 / JCM 9153 / C-125) TaxID=272558 RepID=Q9KB70_HALH5|nr:class I SAM-dependent methyltransferase [Halalkalibacterium halodurans]MED4173776.1 class I SAM-dependent methyltransferase [Halalkalibacterium halodurans]BAB05777.1 BH2058 [Halalkalibacterium halodurans C-125]
MVQLIKKYEDLLCLLDELIKNESTFRWDEFYLERERDVPFFVLAPDEQLVEYVCTGLIESGKVLELGCGPGRNAIYLAENHFEVDVVDLSQKAIDWAMDRANERKASIRFIRENIFNLNVNKASYDLVYDSGCFHHIPPHRRMDYIHLVTTALKPGGHFGLTCFIENGPLGGAAISDLDVYRQQSLQGGLGFTEQKLIQIFDDFAVIEIRKMKEYPNDSSRFGVNGLLTALFQKKKVEKVK